MEIEWQPIQNQQPTPAAAIFDKPANHKHILLLLLNVVLLIVGGSASPIFVRIYFLHGGNRKWFASFLQTAAFPFLLLPLLFSFSSRRRRSSASHTPLFLISPFLLISSTVIGILTGLVNFFYSYGSSYLPVSTSSLLISTQLGFTALFAFLIVRQKFTAPTINSVVLLTFSAVVLGVHSNGDRPEGESTAKYLAGFAMMLGAAVLYGLVLPLTELMYNKAKQDISYTLVMEIQFVIAAAATAFCAVGMAANNDFQAISEEGHLYRLGETKYYVVVVFIALLTEALFLGITGTINYSSALVSGIALAICIPISEVLAVLFLHEKFDAEKGVSLSLAIWGMISYFYGEYKTYLRNKTTTMEHMVPISTSLSSPVN
ncbi:Purine permease 3 [Platanthera guangdongensis]|uniref:Probable purine permease n=1 Tax=Platanthera guangdongensis TaxID=2320717 RepID=A0ABR2MK26_9ASPA